MASSDVAPFSRVEPSLRRVAFDLGRPLQHLKVLAGCEQAAHAIGHGHDDCPCASVFTGCKNFHHAAIRRHADSDGCLRVFTDETVNNGLAGRAGRVPPVAWAAVVLEKTAQAMSATVAAAMRLVMAISFHSDVWFSLLMQPFPPKPASWLFPID